MIKKKYAYDVVVCGGGVAGFTAAVQSARMGLKTALIEKFGVPGGILTILGNPHIALFYAFQKQIIRGIGWEFCERLCQSGNATLPDWGNKSLHHSQLAVDVNITAAAAMMDEMLLESGVNLFYRAAIVDCKTKVENNISMVDSVVVSSKEGLVEFTATQFIDATGDGDVCAWAGAKFLLGDKETGALQPGTLRYYPSGPLPMQYSEEQINELYSDYLADGKADSEDIWSGDHKNAALIFRDKGDNINHINMMSDYSLEAITEIEISARKSLMRTIGFIKHANLPQILSLAPETAAREGRRILCEHFITAEEYMNATKFQDSICYSFYPIDLHQTGNDSLYNIFLDCIPTIPLSAMYVKGFSNLSVAGRCISGDRLAQSAFRVKASCMAMGQAIGAAASLAAQNKRPLRDIPIEEIKLVLQKCDCIVP